MIAVFSLGLGAIIRNTAGGIAAFAAILFVIPPLMNVLPQSWNDAASRYLPSNAGRAILAVTPDSGSLVAVGRTSPCFCGYAAAILGVAAILLAAPRHVERAPRVGLRAGSCRRPTHRPNRRSAFWQLKYIHVHEAEPLVQCRATLAAGLDVRR